MGRSPKRTTKESRAATLRILESITGSDALSILKRLAERDNRFAEAICETARELLGDVDSEDVAMAVQMELETLDVEEVWDRSGAKRDGYIEPGDAAWQMFEEALKPFQDEIEKYKSMSMSMQARRCCEGILKGIYMFHNESATEYKDWAVDAPAEYFDLVLDDWKRLFKGRPPRREMERFLETRCPDWAEWSVRQLRKRKQ